MPRIARYKSASGVYHIMLRGIDKQQIFEDEGDNLKFLYILHDTLPPEHISLLAYCLMGNHVHLLLKVPAEATDALEHAMKIIGMRYTNYFNRKNQRLGPLYQGRFKSEPVEDTEYLLRVVRYIHNNPVKAGICQTMRENGYSSYCDYFYGRQGICEVDRAFVFAKAISPAWFMEFHARADNPKAFLDYTEYMPPLTDTEIRSALAAQCGCQTVEDFQRLPPERQAAALRAAKDAGAKVAQLSRLTAVPVGKLYRILRAQRTEESQA